MNITKYVLAMCCLFIPFFTLNVQSEIRRGESKVLQQTLTQPPACFWQFTGDTESIAVVKGVSGASAFREGNLIRTEYTHAGNTGCNPQILNTIHTWNQLASRLTPGQTVKFNVSASWNLVGSASCTSLTTGLHTTITAGTTTIKADQSKVILSKEPSGAVANSGSWVVPAGAREGATMTVSANANTGIGGGTVTYAYRYVCPTVTPNPTQTTTKGILSTLTRTPTITVTPTKRPCPCPIGASSDSGARFGDLSGEVTIAHCTDLKDNRPADYDMVISRNSYIQTEAESQALLAFADNTTFLMKPFTKVWIECGEPHQSKISMLAGKVWANVKQMVKDGTMDVTMNQAAASIKGTTFVLEETGQVSTLKVLDGSVTFTSRANGKSVAVTTGQSVSATAAGLSAIVPFDIAQEAALWPEPQSIGKPRQPAATQSSEDGSDVSTWTNWLFIICAASLVLFALVGLIALIVRSKKRKSSPNTP